LVALERPAGAVLVQIAQRLLVARQLATTAALRAISPSCSRWRQITGSSHF